MKAVRLTVDGRELVVEGGTTVAAALLNAGITTFRTSSRGAARAPLCGMGICHECRVSIDGISHRRSCLMEAVEGMTVTTTVAPSSLPVGSDVHEYVADIAVIGAGPAGIAAAVSAAERGMRVALIDEGCRAGGQIWRNGPHAAPSAAARQWLVRLQQYGVNLLANTAVSRVHRTPTGVRICGERFGDAVVVDAGRLILATGARELFLPFPGSTLPNVLGIGGVQALIKGGMSVRGKRVVVAGAGPLLLPVAASLASHGATLLLVAEQASLESVMRFAAGLWRHPSSLLLAAKYRSRFMTARYATGTWASSAHGSGRVESVVITDGVTSRTLQCDLLCVSHGLVPNTELARLLGCAIAGNAVVVGDICETSLPGIYCAGETTGIGGVDVALAEGTVAGLAAAGVGKNAVRQVRRLQSLRRLAGSMNRAFALRMELKALASADTIVCRCEDVSLGAVRPEWSARKAKLYTRVGMGPCQGRVCGAALEVLHGAQQDVVRVPAQPVLLTTLVAQPESAAASTARGN